MRDMLRLSGYRSGAKEVQKGFTLVELLVALALSAILIVGTLAIFRVLLIDTATSKDKAVADLQVHYVQYWISNDVVQAGNITLGNSTGNFPLTITIPGNETWGGNSTVIYNVEDMKDELGNDLWRLYRTEIAADGTSGTSKIAEYLLPWLDTPEMPEDYHGTRCTVEGNVTAYESRVILEVGALVDESTAIARYTIHPRLNPGNTTG